MIFSFDVNSSLYLKAPYKGAFIFNMISNNH